ncbi:MAG: hypothetical protein NT004_10295 [Bacteroidetes bacterium]|nr:hypothetical protein [Bacteroidota bacterium]
MKRNSIILLSLFMLCSIWILYSCKKDFAFDRIKGLDWNPDLAVPLVKDSITFERALIETDTEKNFYIDENGEVSILFYFKNKAFCIKANDLVSIPALDFSYKRQITTIEEQTIKTQDFPIPPITFSVNLAQSSPELIVNELLVKKGKIIANSSHTFNNPGYMSVTILNATKNGNPFASTFGPFIKGISTDTIDISGVLFDLSATPNILSMQIGGLIKQSENLVAGDIIQTDYTVLISEIETFKGYLGQQTFTPLEESVKVTAFNNAYVLGEIYFTDPQVSITIVNSIGIPSAITIEHLKAYNEASNVTLDVTDRLGANAYFEVPSPEFNAPKPVTKTMDYTNENTGNSMYDLFNLKPDRVFFKIKNEINPHGKTFNFFSDNDSLYADLKVRLPLFGHFDHLTLQDTFDFSLNQQKEIEMVEFKTKIKNGMPLMARMQVYFTDSVYNKLDSLTGTDNILIEEAPVDPTTFLPYPGMFGVKDTSFFLDKSRMDGIVNARKIIVRAVMNTSDGGAPNVKIKAAQLLSLDFSALVRLRKTISPGK